MQLTAHEFLLHWHLDSDKILFIHELASDLKSHAKPTVHKLIYSNFVFAATAADSNKHELIAFRHILRLRSC